MPGRADGVADAASPGSVSASSTTSAPRARSGPERELEQRRRHLVVARAQPARGGRAERQAPRAGRRPRGRCRAAPQRGRRPSRACGRARARRSPGRRRRAARASARALCACGRPVGRRAGLAARARRTPRVPGPSPAAAPRRRRAGAASPATRRAAALRRSAAVPLDHHQPPVAGLRALRRMPLDRRRGRCPPVATGTGAAPLSPSSQSAPARAPAARVASRAIACPTCAPSAPPASASPDQVERVVAGPVVRVGRPARQAASTAIWLAAEPRQRPLGLGEGAGRAQQLDDAEPLTAGLDRHREHAAGARALGHAAQPAGRRVQRSELARRPPSSATQVPSSSAASAGEADATARATSRPEARSASRRTTVSAPVPAASASASAASRSSRPAGPERRPLAPVLDRPLPGVWPLTDASRRRPS